MIQKLAPFILLMALVVVAGCKTPQPLSDTENICTIEGTQTTMALSEAKALGAAGCINEGTLTNESFCNNVTGTWWVILNPTEPKEGCNPACVVDIMTKEAGTNWRCTGAQDPEQELCQSGGYNMTLGEAKTIAVNSNCTLLGQISSLRVCDETRLEWVLTIIPNDETQNCEQLCVVNVVNRTAETVYDCGI
jgi:hypothetical protein